MLEFLSDADPGDETDSTEIEDAIGEDLEAGYQADFNPINFVDPGLLIAIAQLAGEPVISRAEARELLGLDAGE